MDEVMLKRWKGNDRDYDETGDLDPITFSTIADGVFYVVAGDTLYALG